MKLFNISSIFILLYFTANSECKLLNKNNLKFVFKCSENRVEVFCRKDNETCEIDISEKLEAYGATFENGKIQSLKEIDTANSEKTLCSKSSVEGKVNCEVSVICQDSFGLSNINGLGFLNDASRGNFSLCHSIDHKIYKTLSFGEDIKEISENEIISSLAKFTNNFCQNTNKSGELFKRLPQLIKTINRGIFSEKCLREATNSTENRVLSFNDKLLFTKNILNKLLEDLPSDLNKCDLSKSNLFWKGKLDLDHYLCLKISEFGNFKGILCSDWGDERHIEIESELLESNTMASAILAARNPESTEGAKAIPVELPKEIQSIPLKETYNHIAELVDGNSVVFNEKISAEAGRIFEPVYTQITSLHDFVSSKTSNSDRSPASSGNSLNPSRGNKLPVIRSSKSRQGTKETNNKPSNFGRSDERDDDSSNEPKVASGGSNRLNGDENNKGIDRNGSPKIKKNLGSPKKGLQAGNSARAGDSPNFQLISGGGTSISNNVTGNTNSPSKSNITSDVVAEFLDKVRIAKSAGDLVNVFNQASYSDVIKRIQSTSEAQNKGAAVTARGPSSTNLLSIQNTDLILLFKKLRQLQSSLVVQSITGKNITVYPNKSAKNKIVITSNQAKLVQVKNK